MVTIADDELLRVMISNTLQVREGTRGVYTIQSFIREDVRTLLRARLIRFLPHDNPSHTAYFETVFPYTLEDCTTLLNKR